MRLALAITAILLSGYSTSLAGTDETNFPFPPEVQACRDQFPSVSKEPDAALRCADILEVAALAHWKANYVARHPAAKVCRDNPPWPSDHSLKSLCSRLINEEETAIAHRKDILHSKKVQFSARVRDLAAGRAARPICDAACQRLNAMSVEELDAELARRERDLARMEQEMDMTLSLKMREPILIPFTAHAEYLGNLSANEFDPNSVANPYGAGSPYSSNSVANEFGIYGSPYSNQSATNPYATEAPRLYDQQGNYRGELSTNQYDPDSVSNPYGRYGNPYSPDSLNNPYGAGNPYRSDSPRNPYGQGWRIEGR